MTRAHFLFSTWVVLLIAALSGCSSFQRPVCGPEVRAAYDIGSGSTKLKVAEVDTCQGKILKVLLEDQRKVDYRDDLSKGNGNRFSDHIQAEGEKALRELNEKAKTLRPRQHQGVATQAFRTATNGPEFASALSSRLGIAIRIISQAEEAELGFRAAMTSLPSNSDLTSFAVWDIGGGSQQLTVASLHEPGLRKTDELRNELGAVAFKNLVIQEVLKRNPARQTSPNPMSKSQLRKAIALAEKQAQAWPKDALRSSFIVGVGGVLSLSLPKRLENSEILNREAIEQQLYASAGLRDQDLKSPFSETELTNMALVLGFMRHLGVERYSPSKAQLVDSVLTMTKPVQSTHR